jgi:PAS domain S-box-containing protein
MRLSIFIAENKESILGAWESFARTIEPPALTMDSTALRDHASLMLDTIIADLDTPQTPFEQSEKAMGQAPREKGESYAEIHATQRLQAGYTINQLVSEYRALRASVLRLWAKSPKFVLMTDPDDVTRFNEAIDQALAESVSRFNLMAMDINAQKKMEAALRESEAKFRTIANAMPQMVWSTLPDGLHDYYNQRWYDYTGVPEGSTDGEGWAGMFHPEDRDNAWAAWRHSLATGEVYEVQYRLRHHSGVYHWTLGRALPIRDDSGVIVRWMGTCTDIHEQKLAEELLKEESQRKDEFLAMLAHELRNPLAPISTAAQMLKIVGADEKRVRHASDVIARQVKHMTNLVDDLLDVSRITRGLVELEAETLDLKLILSGAVEQARPLIEARHHELHIRLSSELVFVKGDKTRLVQVIANLLNNAAKYTPQNGEIELILEIHEGLACVYVRDNGSGIAPTLLPYIFDLFTQGERTPDRAQGGLGLGLSLVKNITALHGGRVAAASEGLGKGSTFSISLPLVEKEMEEPLGTPLMKSASPEIGPLHLMIVDDNLDAAQSLAALLEAVGHQVTVLEDADSALLAAADIRVQVFILDIGLPGMDGYELARRLRALPATAGAAIIALTGYGQAHDRVLTKAAGFDHHFVKPIDIQQLAKVLEQVFWAERRKAVRSAV